MVTLSVGCLGPTTAPDRKKPPLPIAALPPAPPAGEQLVWATDPTTNVMTSRWYLQLDGQDATLTLTRDGAYYAGSITNSDGSTDTVDNVRWDPSSGVLELRRAGAGYWQWLHARAVEGVLVGRVSSRLDSGDPPGDVSLLTQHVVGWSDAYFGRDIVPRSYDLTVGGKHARLRLDRDGSGALFGRFKVFADDERGDLAEEVEYDVEVQKWDGKALTFVRRSPTWTQTFDALASDGRALAGTMFSSFDGTTTPFVGKRAALAGWGLVSRDSTARDDWQARTRRMLAHLMMTDNPAPASFDVSRQPRTISPSNGSETGDRDDQDAALPPAFSVDELRMSLTVPSPYGGPAMTRAIHGYLATPTGARPATGWPAVVVLNGHDGSAQGTLDPTDDMYWYGDAWARRGYVVLAIDVGHRPLEDRAQLYEDYDLGDRPDQGNDVHPAIKVPGLDTDWAEDGERVWDVERGVDWLMTLGNVDAGRIAITGLSMGAEVATLAGALDTRFAAVVPAGYAPDMTVIGWHGNHPCYLWNWGDPLDWYDVADLHALIAPRALLVEVGHRDDSFSDMTPPFSDAKEVTRRSRAAYADAADHFIVYLHPGPHEYRFGGDTIDGATGLGITVPALLGPQYDGDLSWASDDTINPVGRMLGDELQQFLPVTAKERSKTTFAR